MHLLGEGSGAREIRNSMHGIRTTNIPRHETLCRFRHQEAPLVYAGIGPHMKIIAGCLVDQRRVALAAMTLTCVQPELTAMYFRGLGECTAGVEATAMDVA